MAPTPRAVPARPNRPAENIARQAVATTSWQRARRSATTLSLLSLVILLTNPAPVAADHCATDTGPLRPVVTCPPRIDGVTEPAAMDPAATYPTAPIAEPDLPLHLRRLRPPHPQYLAFLLEHQERLGRYSVWRRHELPDAQLDDELQPLDQDCLRLPPGLSIEHVSADQLALVFVALPVAPLDGPPWVDGPGALRPDPDYDPAEDYWVVAAAEGYDVGLRVTDPARFLQLNDDGSFLDLGRAVRLHHWPRHRAAITGRLYVQRLSEGDIRVTTRMLQPDIPLAAFDAAALDETALNAAALDGRASDAGSLAAAALDGGVLEPGTAPPTPPWRPARIIEPIWDPATLDGPTYTPRSPVDPKDCGTIDPCEGDDDGCCDAINPCCGIGDPCCGDSNPCCDGTGRGGRTSDQWPVASGGVRCTGRGRRKSIKPVASDQWPVASCGVRCTETGRCKSLFHVGWD